MVALPGLSLGVQQTSFSHQLGHWEARSAQLVGAYGGTGSGEGGVLPRGPCCLSGGPGLLGALLKAQPKLFSKSLLVIL